MTNKWQRIADLFDQALARPAADRHRWLDQACGDDTTLQRTVEQLLLAHERTAGILEETPRQWMDEDPPVEAAEVGDRLGPYRLLREIGRGGMGTVYLAERADDAFDHRVAIKVLRHVVSRDSTRRFEFERQILATLDHPNIATLHGGGRTDDGRPYLVMEYVDGVPLIEHCDRQQLSMDERVELFITVADAVQAAHRALVVHRDLKPSNILVTGDGRVKLVDFGIAKWLDPGAGGSSLRPPDTRPGHRPMTPAYASPEQVRGQSITTASDVYQLGLILYELLTGRRPYEVRGRSPSEVERIICDDTPPRPSASLSRLSSENDTSTATVGVPSAWDRIAMDRQTWPSRLRQRLEGDLDAIIMTAIRKEPDRRYASAADLADDLRRFLDDRPVDARGDSRIYQVSRFLQRHRWESAAAVAFLLLLVAYAVTVTVQSRRIGDALQEARTEAETSAQVTSFLLDLFEANAPSEALGDTVTARELMARGVERAESLDDEPVVQAKMFDVVGRVYLKLGEYDRSEQLLRRSLKQRRELRGPHHLDVATSLNDLAETLEVRGRLDTAAVLYREALTIRERHLGRDDPLVAASLNNLGELRMNQGRYDDARPLLQDALDLRRDLLGPRNPEVAVSLNNLGMLHWNEGRYDQAEKLVREAMSIRRAALGPAHVEIVWDLNNLGLILEDAGRLQEAERLLRESLTMSRRLYGDEHPEVADALSNLASVVGRRGQTQEERRLAEQAFEMRQRLLGPGHPDVAISLNNLASHALQAGQEEAAEERYREAVKRFRDAFGADHPHVAYPLLGLARTLVERGTRFGEATRSATEALQLRTASLPSDHWLIGETRSVLGASLAGAGQRDSATRSLEQGYAALRQAEGRDIETRWALRHLIQLHRDGDEPAKAAAYTDTLARLREP